MIKTISFVARPERFQEFLRTLEANLRRDIATLEEDAQFEGESQSSHRLRTRCFVGDACQRGLSVPVIR